MSVDADFISPRVSDKVTILNGRTISSPDDNFGLANKQYVDTTVQQAAYSVTDPLYFSAPGVVAIREAGSTCGGVVTDAAQQLAGTKTFLNGAQAPAAPVVDTDLANKLYVDTQIISSGLTFDDPLIENSKVVSITPAGATAGGYITTGTQDIAGVKKFSSLPSIPQIPSVSTDAASKGYVDQQVAAGVLSFNTPLSVVSNTVSITAADYTVPGYITTGAQNISGVKTFSSNPIIPLIPINSTDSASKGYVDQQDAAAVLSFTNPLTKVSNTVSLAPADGTTPGYVTGSAQAFAGVKTFNSLPSIPQTPVSSTDAASKGYVDQQIAAGVLSFTSPLSEAANTVSIAAAAGTTPGYVTGSAQTFAGVKTFSSLPSIPQTPSASTDAASKGYVDQQDAAAVLSFTSPLSKSSNTVSMTAAGSTVAGYITTGSQNISGVKTFDALPSIPQTPIQSTDAASKGYVDQQISAGVLSFTSPLSEASNTVSISAAAGTTPGYVTSAAQTFAGVKTFSSLPVIPQTPSASTDAASKGYVDQQDAAAVLSFTSPMSKTSNTVSITAADTTTAGYITTGAQNISGVKTFSALPSIPLTPISSTDSASKGYVDQQDAAAVLSFTSPLSKASTTVSIAAAAGTTPGYVTGTAQTFAGVKTFSSLPSIPQTPSASTDAASKGYVDQQDAAAVLSFTSPLSKTSNTVSITAADTTVAGYITTGSQNIAGVKTFTSLPSIPQTPSSSTDAASKGYVDQQDAAAVLTFSTPLSKSSNTVSITAADSTVAGYITTGAQNIAGVKTFAALPSIPQTPSAATDAASKGYVDQQDAAAVLSFTSPLSKTSNTVSIAAASGTTPGYVTGSAQTFAGVKTFSSLPSIPQTPSSTTDAASKGYVDQQIAAGVLSFTSPISVSSNVVAMSSASGTTSGYVTGTAQTFAGVKTFSSLPSIPQTPAVSTDAASKGYVDQQDAAAVLSFTSPLSVSSNTVSITAAAGTTPGYVTGTAQTFAGVKTFSSLPSIPQTPSATTDAASKGYVDQQDAAAVLSFTAPLSKSSNTVSIAAAAGTTPGYVTGAAQTFAGVKTFSSLPSIPQTPSATTDAASKGYVDQQVADNVLSFTSPLSVSSNVVVMSSASGTTSGYVTGSAQTFAGVKTFSSLPSIPLTPSATTDAASKGYVDSYFAPYKYISYTQVWYGPASGTITGTYTGHACVVGNMTTMWLTTNQTTYTAAGTGGITYTIPASLTQGLTQFGTGNPYMYPNFPVRVNYKGAQQIGFAVFYSTTTVAVYQDVGLESFFSGYTYGVPNTAITWINC